MSDKTYKIVGLMSGSSLDGLDVALTTWHAGQWRLEVGVTIDYDSFLVGRLQQAPQMSGQDLMQLDADFGKHCADAVHREIGGDLLHEVDLVVSHGHTVHHAPDKGYSVQIGSGAVLSSNLAVDVLCDLRTQDIAMGGQGAPLAALIDGHLFGKYAYCLNLGGIANVSINTASKYAWDICAANQVLNFLAQQTGHPYDDGGKLARSGNVVQELLDTWGKLDYYQLSPPKSLDNGWVREHVLSSMPVDEYAITDLLRTYVEFIAQQVAMQLSMVVGRTCGKMLVTGGGVHNDFLVERLQDRLSENAVEVCIPEAAISDYKEAILMAMMGYHYLEGIANTVHMATGARQAVIGGAFYKGRHGS